MIGAGRRVVSGAVAHWFGAGLALVADFLMPPRCMACQTATQAHGGLCARCWRDFPAIDRPYCERLGTPFAYDHGDGMLSAEAIAAPPRYQRARAAARYEAVAVDLVHRLKYGDHTELAGLMGRLMARAGRDVIEGADLLLPVPLHRWRLWRRRFNQSALLADEVARLTGVPHDPFILVRRRRTRRQVGLTRSERARNVQGAFAVRDDRKAALLGRRVILVDDVLTSGATIDAATAVLLRAGAKSVDVLVFARVAQPSAD